MALTGGYASGSSVDMVNYPMRFFVNLFLLLFLADGSVSILDELVTMISPSELLSGARNLLANSVIVMAVALYLCLGIDRRLPKRVFLPLILFVFLCPLSAWFFPALSGNRGYGLLAALAQGALVILPLSSFLRDGRRSLTMPLPMFESPLFSIKNTLVFGAVNIFVIPLALAMLVLYTANSYMAVHTSGFMRIAPGGIYMSERVYRRDNRTIRLAGMIHVGERGYYDELGRSLAPGRGRTIVLAEGVTDDKELLRSDLDYGRVAGLLGLTSQEELRFRGRLIGPEALEKPAMRSREGGENEPAAPADILRADLDVSAFRAPTILFLNTMGKELQESRSLTEGLMAINAWAEKNITPEMHEVILDDILYRRNREVLRYLGKALDRYDTVVIPWGALHMKEIEGEVLKRGFVLQEERERVSMEFRNMLPVGQ
jgi:hypothetical protein